MFRLFGFCFLMLAILCSMASAGEPRCYQSIDPSHCEAYIPKFAYDMTSGKCVDFIWGGCEGNSNRFDTIEECQEACEQ